MVPASCGGDVEGPALAVVLLRAGGRRRVPGGCGVVRAQGERRPAGARPGSCAGPGRRRAGCVRCGGRRWRVRRRARTRVGLGIPGGGTAALAGPRVLGRGVDVVRSWCGRDPRAVAVLAGDRGRGGAVRGADGCAALAEASGVRWVVVGAAGRLRDRPGRGVAALMRCRGACARAPLEVTEDGISGVGAVRAFAGGARDPGSSAAASTSCARARPAGSVAVSCGIRTAPAVVVLGLGVDVEVLGGAGARRGPGRRGAGCRGQPWMWWRIWVMASSLVI
ncbi:hypothetical protein WM457_03029 (plasmid) [Clavibacter nebraskensis]